MAITFVISACGRDGYVVVKEAKTPHRAFDLPTFGTNMAEPPTPPLSIVPIETPPAPSVTPLERNRLSDRPVRAAKAGEGTAELSVTFTERTGDRTSSYPEGSVKDCALFKTPGEKAAQQTLLYAHLAAPGRELRLGLEMILFEGKTPFFDLGRLREPYSPAASLTLRPVLLGRSLLDAKDSEVDAEGPPMWAMDTVLRRQALDTHCRANATVTRQGGAPVLEMALSCGAIAADASTQAIQKLDVSVTCAARETARAPYFVAEEKR